ncbi:MAG: 2-C-methyl-D-erythritol 4-phosphate cytidylyltransferase [Phycisphaerales bacterium]
MRLAVILPAAGASSRYRASGGLRSKIDEDLGGRPVLQRTVEIFIQRDETACVIVAGPADEWDDFLSRHGDKLGLLGVKLCKGGETRRYETVRNALALVPADCTHVAVHDAARPCTPPELIDRILLAAEKHAAVIPALDVPDTVKRVAPSAVVQKDIDPLDAILSGGSSAARNVRAVEATISRERLVLVQTPQVFSRELLLRAYAQPDLTSTDDASLIEKLGEPVMVVEGDPRNIKVTRPVDLQTARLILQFRPPAERETHKRF